MEYKNIRGTGLTVSRACLGTMTFGEQTEEADAIKIVDHAIEQGINFFDTAGTYTKGRSEEILGKALEGKGDACSCPRGNGECVQHDHQGH